MVIETNQEKETYALGVQMGQSAKPGAVYTLVCLLYTSDAADE